ncbi:MAG: hypothetical protein JRF57_09835 [Deltaproteobacteria bacterium]|nr:hypothetical protein [Deltaproteobacteria bacterium]
MKQVQNGKEFIVKELEEILIRRLKSKGMESGHIPGFIRDTARAVTDMGDANLEKINQRLNVLGWNDIKLDEHTFQLMLVELETNGKPLSSRGSCLGPQAG